MLSLATLSALGWYFLAGESLAFPVNFVAVLVIAQSLCARFSKLTAMVGTGMKWHSD